VHIHSLVKSTGRPIRELCLSVRTECTASRLRHASRAISRIHDRILAPSGLRGTQFNVLVALSIAGVVPLLRVAEELGVDRTTLTRNLGPLERDGLVASSPGKDQRIRLLRLTEKGTRALQQALPLWQEAQEKVVGGLGKRRWRELLDGLDAATHLEGPE
jgi:DNA-binding MarR family transcriptional regulator